MSRKTFTFLLINVLFVFSSLSLEAQNPQNADKNTRYLALGDSLAFGYNPLIQPPNLSNYVGYPDIVSQSLHLTMANASCPGETSGTFVGSSSTFLPGFNCIPLQSDGGLFVPYNGAPTQLAYAVNYLQSNPNPQLVTINIGVNDIGLLQANCTAATPTNAAAIATCETTGLPAVLSTFGQNLATIYQELRATGYTGPIVALNAAPFNYSDPQQLLAFTSLNLVISEVSSKFNVSVANVFQAFATAS
ncbi:MAG TPA: SGNH/GDSL hydrolase family protein, partial [Bryobacteraceae bacterium]|nr:SGNH/GDSL hydrolase family protein [Bryobacteraceae bacterium]